jgi:hypothetical protein
MLLQMQHADHKDQYVCVKQTPNSTKITDAKIHVLICAVSIYLPASVRVH